MDEETKKPTSGDIIEPPKPGGVADWLFNTVGLYKVIAAASSWLNLVVNVIITLPDGTTRTGQCRPKIAPTSSTLELPVDLSQSGLLQSGGEIMFPFKIYNITNNTGDAALDNYTFQIRSGLVSARSYLEVGSGASYSNSVSQGNFEQILYMGGTDNKPVYQFNLTTASENNFDPATVNTGTNVIIDNTAETVICDPQNGISYAQFLVNSTPDGQGNFLAAIYIRLEDHLGFGVNPKLVGRMFSYDGSGGRSDNPFPQENNVIPIGICGICADNITPTVVVGQHQFGNLINRFPLYATTFRGEWTDNGLVNTVFYPNDIVALATFPSGFPPARIEQWRYIGGTPTIVTSPPSSGDPLWQKISTSNI